MAIFWDWADPLAVSPNIADVNQILTGTTGSVRSYFLENSNRLFDLNFVRVIGPIPAAKPLQHYLDTQVDAQNRPKDTDGDGWYTGHVEKWAEAIRAASNDYNFDFGAYDTNHDGKITSDELTILILIPGEDPNYSRGFRRNVCGQESPKKKLKVNGVTILEMIENYMNSAPLNYTTVGSIAHELAHVFLGHTDYYHSWTPPGKTQEEYYYVPFSAWAYSLMGYHAYAGHIDPFAKLKLGWVQPKLILWAGRYRLPDVETRHEIWVLADPSRGADEYFIVENRYAQGNSFDRNLPDSGMAVWHIIEKSNIYGNLPTPPGTLEDAWKTVPKNDWGRRAIQLVRPVFGDPLDDSVALWDMTDPVTGYNLLSSNPNPQHATLKWADGKPSGFSIRWLSAPGPEMEAIVETPWSKYRPHNVTPAISSFLMQGTIATPEIATCLLQGTVATPITWSFLLQGG